MEIPYVVDSPSKAVFEFYVEEEPGGVHTLYLSVDHPDQDGNTWWVTFNDRKSVRVHGSAGRTRQLRVEDVMLRPGRQKLTIHSPGNGAKLYGVEFVQESLRLSPGLTEENQLPVFNRYTRERHFIDIFNRGEEPEDWSAQTSAPWIELSGDRGSLSDGSERIWVTVNYDQAPASRDIQGHINIVSGEQSYRVAVSAFNQTLNAPSGAYIETNGVISMPANRFHQNKNGSVASWRAVTGLGRSGSAMNLEPMNGW